MVKVNPYFELVEKHAINSMNKLKTLSQETLKQLEECKWMYSKQGQQVNMNKIYENAMEKAKELKQEELNSLKALLNAEKTKLQPKITTDINEKILNELVKMNEYNSFKTQLKTMEVEEILEYEQENHLNKEQVNLIKSELAERANTLSGDERTELFIKSRQLQYTPKAKLLEQAYERVEQYNLDSNTFPGMPISDSLTGGVEKLLGKEIINKINEVNYFGDSENIQSSAINELNEMNRMGGKK